MSFDGQTASTLDVVDIVFPSPSRRPRRTSPTKPDASTIEHDLMPQPPLQASTSSIEPMLASPPAFVVTTDATEFQMWLQRTGVGALLEVVARAFTRHMNVTGVEVILEAESEEPNEQRVLMLVPVGIHEHDALERLFSFTSSPWWSSVVRSTRNAIVVDIRHV